VHTDAIFSAPLDIVRAQDAVFRASLAMGRVEGRYFFSAFMDNVIAEVRRLFSASVDILRTHGRPF
jgi:hypothetical protein